MCEQVYFPTGTAKAHTDLVWYERPAVAKAHGHAHKRRLLASAPAMTAEAALRAAEAERLVLQRSTNMTGYKHVGRDMSKPRPYQVKMWHDGKQEHLGYFATPEEAALCYARASRALGLERLPAHQPCQASLQLQTDARPTPDPAASPAEFSVQNSAPAATALPPPKPPTSQDETLHNELQRWAEQFEWQEALQSRFPVFTGEFQAPSVQHEGLQPVSCMSRNDSSSSCVSAATVAEIGRASCRERV